MIDIENLSVSLKTRQMSQAKPVLSDISFSVPAGTCTALIGPSGAGKSTLGRMVGGLLESGPEVECHGCVRIGGGSPAEARAAGRIGYMFQETTVLPWRKVIENVQLPRELGREGNMAAEELLRLVGLEEAMHMYPDELSGGMKKRVSLARALSVSPDVLILDEPFSALDELTREKMQELLGDVRTRISPAVLFITHNVEEAVFVADQVVMLTAAPARVHAVVDVPFAVPRDNLLRESDAFFKTTRQIRRGLGPSE